MSKRNQGRTKRKDRAGRGETAEPGRWRPWLFAAAVAVVAFLAFLPTLDNDFVDWDDRGVLTENFAYRGLGQTQLQWMFTTNHYGHYQPFTWVTYGFDYVLWGMNPTGYHLTNNVFHALNSLLVFFVSLALLRRAFGTGAAAHRRLIEIGALFAALLFAVHPLRVESVAWATERRDLVSAFYLLLTFLAYLRGTSVPNGRSWGWITVSILVYVVSMMSKVGGAPLPFVLLAIDWYPLRRIGGSRDGWLGPDARMVLLEKVPYLLIAIGFSIGTILQQTNRWLVPYADHDFLARTAQAFYGLVFYAFKTFVPVGLVPLYELRFPLNPFAPVFILSAIVVLVAASAFFVLRRRLPGLLVAGLAYALMLGPLLGYFQNGPQVVADRYSYLSCLGWLLLVAGGGVWLAANRITTRGGRAALAGAGGVIVLALAVLTWRQCDVWQDTETLWTYVLEQEPESSFANNSYAYAVLLVNGRAAESVEHFRKAIEINPKNREAWYNLWQALKASGDDAALREAYGRGANSPLLEIRAEAFYRLGNLDLALKTDEGNRAARTWYAKSLELRAGDAETHTNLGLVLNREGNSVNAERHAMSAIQLDPGLRNAWEVLTVALERQGRIDEAINACAGVLRIQPSSNWGRTTMQRLREKQAGTPGATGG